MVKKGTWVQIKKVILKPNERASNIPEDTKGLPLIMWVKGYLLDDAKINDNVKIETATGRIEEGILIAENPTYKHNYGDFVFELIQINKKVKEIVFND